MILFIILINGAFVRPNIPRPLVKSDSWWKELIETKKRENKSQILALKFLDDVGAATVVDMRKSLEKEDRELPLPLTFNQRTGHRLVKSENTLQIELDRFQEYCTKKQMVLNIKKSEVMTFNFSKKLAFPPDLTLDSGETLLKVPVTGVNIQSNLRWAENTQIRFILCIILKL